MHNRSLLEKLSKSFSREGLIGFFRTVIGKFKSKAEDFSHHWVLDISEFIMHARKYSTPNVHLFQSAREEMVSLTEEIVKVERAIDERVKGLYGV